MLDSLITGFMFYGMYMLMLNTLNLYQEEKDKEYRLDINIVTIPILVLSFILGIGYAANMVVEFITRI